MVYCLWKERKLEAWSFSSFDVFKFNVDNALRGKLGIGGIEGVLHNTKRLKKKKKKGYSFVFLLMPRILTRPSKLLF